MSSSLVLSNNNIHSTTSATIILSCAYTIVVGHNNNCVLSLNNNKTMKTFIYQDNTICLRPVLLADSLYACISIMQFMHSFIINS